MEGLNGNNEKVDKDVLVASLKEKGIEDTETKKMLLKWQSQLAEVTGRNNNAYHAALGDLYMEAGLLSLAKGSYYEVAYRAGRPDIEMDLEKHEEFMKKSREIQAPMPE